MKDEGRFRRSDAEWKLLLSPEQYRICRRKATEPAYSGAYWLSREPGVYACVCCGLALFDSTAKYDSGTGWPSFFRPLDSGHLVEAADLSHGLWRTEVRCRRCEAHLGHIFDDDPPPSGRRYCLNSAALTFLPRERAQLGTK